MQHQVMSVTIRMSCRAALLLGLLWSPAAFGQTLRQQHRLMEIATTASQAYRLERARAESVAVQLHMPIRQELADGRVMEIQGLDADGWPYYFITENDIAAQTISTDRVYPGGADGLALTGAGEVLGVWDGGAVRVSHQELAGRVTQEDGATQLNGHATHVSGTMVGAGVRPDARGMSYGARLWAHDWNNAQAEMAAAAARGLQVSNHSYGTVAGWAGRQTCGGEERRTWHGNTSVGELEDFRFGFYSDQSREWDEIAVNAPYYLIVKSAGNDRGDSGPPAGEPYCIRGGNGWVVSSAPRPPDGGPDGYDSMTDKSVAKNILTVGAVRDVPGGYRAPADVQVAPFSAWGPTDDGRIKPDLVANGTGLTSSVESGDRAYSSYTGTSMAAPNAAGSVGLLLEHHRTLNGDTPLRAATLKALLIQAADEAGDAPGPDYRHGWGLMNTSKAAALLSLDARLGGGVIQEHDLADGDAVEIPVTVAEGTGPLQITIAWTDLPGDPPARMLNPRTPMLVNDLDLTVVGPEGTYRPWVLDPAHPGAPARPGDNTRDNVEQVFVAAPPPGDYLVRITHKGMLQGGAQPVSLVLDRGPGPTFALAGRVTLAGEEAGVNGAAVHVTGFGERTATTAADGTFHIAGLYEGTYTVTPAVPGVTFTPASRTVTIDGDDVAGLDFTAVTSGRRRVRLRLNTASIPDTLRATATVQVRGCLGDCTQAATLLPDGHVLARDGQTTLTLRHAGGDYWELAFEVPEQETVRFKYYVASSGASEAGEDHRIAAGIGDVTLPVHFFEPETAGVDRPYDWRPWTPREDHVAVQYRVYVPEHLSPLIVGVRGDDLDGTGPLRWDQPRLQPEREADDEARPGYRLYSAVAYYPAAAVGRTQTYRFSLEFAGWRGATLRSFVVPARDTTLHWVYAANGLPVPGADQARLQEDAAVTVDVQGNDRDPDGDTLVVASVGPGAHGTTLLGMDGTVTYTPAADYHGADTFTYTLRDAHGATAQGDVTVRVTAVNDAPTAVAVAGDSTAVWLQGDPAEVFGASWAAAVDPDGDRLTYTWQLAADTTFTDAALLLSVSAAAQTRADVPFGTLATRLTAYGLGTGETAVLYHRVLVTDGVVTVPGAAAAVTFRRGTLTGIEADEALPARVTLAGNYPNPFNPATTIRYALPAAAEVHLAVYDALGRRVQVLVDGPRAAGWHEAAFRAEGLPSGLYLYRLRAGGRTRTGTMLLLK